MIKRLRTILPKRRRYAGLFFIFLPFCCLELISLLNSQENTVIMTAGIVCLLTGTLTIVLYAAYRATFFNPFTRLDYKQWLATTPWSYGKPLPLGPTRLVWEDILVIGVIICCSMIYYRYINFELFNNLLGSYPLIKLTGYLVAFNALVFLATHTTCLYLSIYKSLIHAAMVLFLVPLLAYPHLNLWIGMAVFLMIIVLTHQGQIHALKRFPWDASDWTKSQRQLMLDHVFRQGLIGKPLKQVGPPRHNSTGISYKAAFITSLLMGWWVVSYMHLALLAQGRDLILPLFETARYLDRREAGPDDFYEFTFWWYCIVILIAFIRWVRYAGDAKPPIGIRGRIMTGRLIIPKYDGIYIAPLAIIAYGVASQPACLYLGIPGVFTAGLGVFGVMFLALACGPTIEKWQFTGRFSFRSTSIRNDKQKTVDVDIN